MRKIIFILLFVIPLMAQRQTYFVADLSISGSDTISNITNQDTVLYRLAIESAWGLWQTLTNYITAAEKTGETSQRYVLADELAWGWAEYIEFKIESGASVITSHSHNIGGLLGALSIHITPDTTGTNTIYTFKLGGF